MATYHVNAPNRSIMTLNCKLGSFTFNHGDVMYNDKLASLFPSMFVKISDGVPVSKAEPIVVEITTEPIQEVSKPEEITEELPVLEADIPSLESSQEPEPEVVTTEPIQEVSKPEEITEELPVLEADIPSLESSQEPEPEVVTTEEDVQEEDVVESIEGDYQEEDNSEVTPVAFVGKKRGRKPKGN